MKETEPARITEISRPFYQFRKRIKDWDEGAQEGIAFLRLFESLAASDKAEQISKLSDRVYEIFNRPLLIISQDEDSNKIKIRLSLQTTYRLASDRQFVRQRGLSISMSVRNKNNRRSERDFCKANLSLFPVHKSGEVLRKLTVSLGYQSQSSIYTYSMANYSDSMGGQIESRWFPMISGVLGRDWIKICGYYPAEDMIPQAIDVPATIREIVKAARRTIEQPMEPFCKPKFICFGGT